jgi:hypothetical protein
MKHTFNFAKPNFCSGCGQTLGATYKTSDFQLKQSKATLSSPLEEEEDYDDYDDNENTSVDRVPQINRIQIEVESDAPSSFTLGSLFADGAPPSSSTRRRDSQSIGDFINDKPRSGGK